MAGIGLFLIAISYSIVYWGISSIQGNNQKPFATYVFPFAKS